MKETLSRGLHALNLSLDDTAQARLLAYIDLLAKWNRVYNLTAVREARQMIARHLLDSLVLLPWLDGQGGLSAPRLNRPRAQQGDDVAPTLADLLDIGSGAGIPVIPLAIARPDLDCVSVEPNGKKVRFQRQAGLELGLSNLTVRETRVEDCSILARTVTSRAFTAPLEFLTLAERLCPAGGQCIVMLGQVDKMPDPLPSTFELQNLQAIRLPGVDAERHLAICRRRNE